MADELSFLFRWRAAILSDECTLSPNGRLVALAVSMHMNSDGGSAFPGGTVLKQRTGLSLRTIRRAEAELEESGWLVVVEHGGAPCGSRRKATHYAADFPTTGVRESLVSQSHRCQIGQGPVPNRTRTGVTVAHQEVKNSYIEDAAAKTDLSPEEFAAERPDTRYPSTVYDRAIDAGYDDVFARAAAAAHERTLKEAS